MEKESKNLLKSYVDACNRYTKEKKQDVIHGKGHEVGSLGTFNQICRLRHRLLESILRENGFNENPIY